MNSSSELNLAELHAVQPSRAIPGVVHVVRESYRLSLLSRDLPWPYDRLYINRLYTTHWLEHRSIQSEK